MTHWAPGMGPPWGPPGTENAVQLSKHRSQEVRTRLAVSCLSWVGPPQCPLIDPCVHSAWGFWGWPLSTGHCQGGRLLSLLLLPPAARGVGWGGCRQVLSAQPSLPLAQLRDLGSPILGRATLTPVRNQAISATPKW